MEYNRLECTEHLINKFSSISEDDWICRVIQYDNKRCTLGHCLNEESKRFDNPIFQTIDLNFSVHPEIGKLLFVFGDLLRVFHINDGVNKDYPQPTPKQRILAALNDIKEIEILTETDSAVSEINKILTSNPQPICH